jgi:peptide/nickel transport system permease protein
MSHLIRRVLTMIATLVLSSVVVFLIIHLIPGDPAELLAGPGVPKSEVELIRKAMGLDKDLASQFILWFSRLLQGDLGRSLVFGDAILPLVVERFGNTFILTLFAMLLAVGAGIPLGILSALKRNSWLDILSMVVSIVGISVPIFWVGLILILVFSVDWGLLPATGSGTFAHLILPGLALGGNSLALIARMTRTSMLEILKQDYIITAEAKGLPQRVIILKHALRNALIPIVTIISLQFGYLLGGAVLTETVFVYPGLGRLLVDAIGRRDYPVVQACILLIVVLFVVINLLLDIAYTYLDPKIRHGK